METGFREFQEIYNTNMKRERESGQWARRMKRSAVAVIATGLFLTVLGIVFYFINDHQVRVCTASDYGTVVYIDHDPTRSRKDQYYKSYFSFEEGSPLHGQKVSIRESERNYEYGDVVKVYYNPADLSEYYLEGTEFGKFAIAMAVMGAGFTAFGVIRWRKWTDYELRRTEELLS